MKKYEFINYKTVCVYVCLLVEENTIATIPNFRQNKINVLIIVINPEI